MAGKINKTLTTRATNKSGPSKKSLNTQKAQQARAAGPKKVEHREKISRSAKAAGAKKWPQAWDLLMRDRFIEIVAQWEGRLTTNHLCATFGIGRQQASRAIARYLQEIAPGNLVLDRAAKGYVPSETFVPRRTSGIADEYLHLLHGDALLNHTFVTLGLPTPNTEVVSPALRRVAPAIVRALVQAAREQRRVEVDYLSMQGPDRDGRVIVPHTLVFSGVRWHVRAYCEKNGDYRDFVLTRFRGEPGLMDASQHGATGDAAWNTEVSVVITPDPRLKPPQQEIIATDYGMTDGRLEIKTRGPLVRYLLLQMQIDPAAWKGDPTSQQIVIQNRAELEPWLFG